MRSLISFPSAVDVVERGVTAAGAEAEPTVAERTTARFGAGWLRIMSGTLPSENVLGFKAFHLIPGRGVRYLCALYRLEDGEPLALIDANYLTSARTSAAAAAAARRFWGSSPLRLAVIGTGTLARDGLRALSSVCSVRVVCVYSRDRDNRDRFLAELSGELGVEMHAVDSAAAATADADMILCATRTEGDVALRARDVGEPRYISSVSSTLPAQRELDGRVIASAGLVVVDTLDALRESGDMLAAARAGFDEDRVVLLADYLRSAARHARSPVVYKSIGSVEQDLALASAIWKEAKCREVGDLIAPVESARA